VILSPLVYVAVGSLIFKTQLLCVANFEDGISDGYHLYASDFVLFIFSDVLK